MNRVLKNSGKLQGKRRTLTLQHLDLSIFSEPKTECYKLTSYDTVSSNEVDDTPVTERCAHSLRLCTASMYFEALRTSSKMDEAAKRALFVEFNEEVYRLVLDDAAHFIKEHEDDIGRVHGEWTERYGLPKCSVSDCAQTERHYGRGRRDRKRESVGEEEDALYAFYESLYDRIHHYIFHLFDVGLRVEASSLLQDEAG